MPWLGLALFALVYALLAVPKLGRKLREAAAERWGRAGDLLLSRPGIAIAGALLLVLFWQVTPLAAWRAIDWRTLALLFGMMLLVAALDVANVFAVIADRLTRVFPTPMGLLVGSMVVVAVLSALVLNDAVVLLFTPVLVRAARAMGVSPIPFLVGEALAANLGSAATPTGNPQNAAIASARDLGFLEFTLPLLPVALVGLAIGVAACALAFRRELGTRNMPGDGTGDRTGGVPGDGSGGRGPEPARIASRPMFALALAAVAFALAGFVVGPGAGVPLWLAAFAAGALALVLSPAARVSPLKLAARVDYGILVFFVGLFVLLEVVRASDVPALLGRAFESGGSGGFVVLTAVLSNLVSNVPAVLLLLPAVTSDGQALLLAAVSTFAGNATFLGSAATVIVAETARHEGADFSVLKFTFIGLPLAAVTIAIAWLMLG